MSIIPSNNVSNENINTGVSREIIHISKIVHFGVVIHVLSSQDIFQITEKKWKTENQQLFDKIIDVTLFDGVEGLYYYETPCKSKN